LNQLSPIFTFTFTITLTLTVHLGPGCLLNEYVYESSGEAICPADLMKEGGEAVETEKIYVVMTD
jgi:hypothetical protein